MTALTWGDLAERRYEAGIDRGVIYMDDQPPIVWNGLVSVNQVSGDREASAHFFDGKKYANLLSPTTYKARIRAYHTPVEFAPCLGERLLRAGIFITDQPSQRFSFSYRTRQEPGDHYKIHLVYNACVVRKVRVNTSMSDETTPSIFEFDLDAIPLQGHNWVPTAHIVLDSRKISVETINEIEDYLWGTDESDPQFMTPEEISYFLE